MGRGGVCEVVGCWEDLGFTGSGGDDDGLAVTLGVQDVPDPRGVAERADHDADAAAAAQADVPGGFVGDLEVEDIGGGVVAEHTGSGFQDGAFDAAAGDRALEGSMFVEDQAAADGAGG